eukprot:m.26962 g.26962  ORF g.26962 m.26962 type:complete len:251 (+) comp7849_c1_seq1:1595-2347(+)
MESTSRPKSQSICKAQSKSISKKRKASALEDEIDTDRKKAVFKKKMAATVQQQVLAWVQQPISREIKGLIYVERFLTLEEEADLLQTVDSHPWRNDLKRRVQHYGWVYNYKNRSVSPSDYLGPLPSWLDVVVSRLRIIDNASLHFNQVIVNEYLPGQGIAPHVDHPQHFGDIIATISLSSDINMDFRPVKCSGDVHSIRLARRSATCISSEARYSWTHGIASRKTDPSSLGRIQRSRRVSLTFRKVILEK